MVMKTKLFGSIKRKGERKKKLNIRTKKREAQKATFMWPISCQIN